MAGLVETCSHVGGVLHWVEAAVHPKETSGLCLLQNKEFHIWSSEPPAERDRQTWEPATGARRYTMEKIKTL